MLIIFVIDVLCCSRVGLLLRYITNVSIIPYLSCKQQKNTKCYRIRILSGFYQSIYLNLSLASLSLFPTFILEFQPLSHQDFVIWWISFLIFTHSFKRVLMPHSYCGTIILIIVVSNWFLMILYLCNSHLTFWL